MQSATSYEPKGLPFEELDGISKKTMEIHHDKLYQGYVKKLQEVSERIKNADPLMFSNANQSYSELRALRDGETFATGGVYLHEYYFAGLGGDGKPAGALVDELTEKWGSFEAFQHSFSATGMAMRGWVVLAWDLHLQRLKIYGCDAHNQGGIWSCIPLLVLDVYEHAYFLDFGSDRKAYIEAFWKNIDWKSVNEKYLKVKSFTL